MIRPARPTGNSQHAHFWQWVWDTIEEQRPRHSPYSLTAVTTRGVFESLFPQRSNAQDKKTFKVTWFPRIPPFSTTVLAQNKAPLANVEGGFCFNYAQAELTLLNSNNFVGIAARERTPTDYVPAVPLRGSTQLYTAFSKPFSSASIRLKMTAPIYADAVPDLDFPSNPIQLSTGESITDFPATATQPCLYVKLLELPFADSSSPSSGFKVATLTYQPSESHDGYFVYSLSPSITAVNTSFIIAIPDENTAAIISQSGVIKPPVGNGWEDSWVIANTGFVRFVFRTNNPSATVYEFDNGHSEQIPNWRNFESSGGAIGVANLFGGPFAIYTVGSGVAGADNLWTPADPALNRYRIGRFPGSPTNQFLPVQSTFSHADVQAIPLTEEFDKTIDFPAARASGVFIIQAFFARPLFAYEDGIFPLRYSTDVAADYENWEFTLEATEV